MYCKNCGKNLPDDAIFCNICGANVFVPRQKSRRLREHLSHFVSTLKQNSRHIVTSKKTWGIVVIAAIAAIVIGITSFLYSAGRDIRSFKALMKKQDTIGAIQEYRNLSYQDRTAVDNWLQEYIVSIENAYYNGDYDYTTAQGILQDLRKFDAVLGEVDNAANRIFMDNESSIAFETAKKYQNKEKWKEAYTALQNIDPAYRSYEEAVALRAECAKKYREAILKQCDTSKTQNDYAASLKTLREALQVLSDDPELMLKLQEYSDEFTAATLEQAAALAEKGDYDSAIALLSNAQNGEYSEAFAIAIDEYDFSRLVSICEEVEQSDGYQAVVRYLNDVHATDSDEKRNALLAGYEEKLKKQTLDAAMALADERKFSEASQLIENVQKDYDCAEFYDLLSIYDSKMPIKLSKCHVIESDNIYLYNVKTDAFGIDREDIIYSENGSLDSYIILYPDQNYIRLLGEIVSSSGSNKERTKSVKIYTDGVLVYESPELSKSTAAIPIDIDVSGCSQLKLEFHGYAEVIVDATLS